MTLLPLFKAPLQTKYPYYSNRNYFACLCRCYPCQNILNFCTKFTELFPSSGLPFFFPDFTKMGARQLYYLYIDYIFEYQLVF